MAAARLWLVPDTRKGHRPSVTDTAPPEQAEPLCAALCKALGAEGVRVAQGLFGARTAVALVDDGPVTIVLDG